MALAVKDTQILVGGNFTQYKEAPALYATGLNGQGDVFSSDFLVTVNGAADGTLTDADATTNLSGSDTDDYAVVPASTHSCTGGETYSRSDVPTAGDALFMVGNAYRICVPVTAHQPPHDAPTPGSVHRIRQVGSPGDSPLSPPHNSPNLRGDIPRPRSPHLNAGKTSCQQT